MTQQKQTIGMDGKPANKSKDKYEDILYNKNRDDENCCDNCDDSDVEDPREWVARITIESTRDETLFQKKLCHRCIDGMSFSLIMGDDEKIDYVYYSYEYEEKTEKLEKINADLLESLKTLTNYTLNNDGTYDKGTLLDNAFKSIAQAAGSK